MAISKSLQKKKQKAALFPLLPSLSGQKEAWQKWEKFALLGIFVVALILRVVTLFRLDWLTDEIAYVDQMGQWFAHNFFAYIFQFEHRTYPPTSPYFANPPLSVWILSFGIGLGNLLHISTLFTARAVNVAFGLATMGVLFVFLRRHFPAKVAHLSLALIAILPILVVFNSVAYLDTISSFFVALFILFLFRYLEKGDKKTIFLAATFASLGILTKLLFVVVLASGIGLIFVCAFLSGRFRDFWRRQKKNLINALCIFVLLPVVLWAGLRDWDHIRGVYEYFTVRKGFGLLTSWGFWDSVVYYFRMPLGIFQPVVSLLFLGFVGVACAAIFVKKLRSRFSPLTVFFLVYILAHLFFVSFFAKYSTAHQLLPILPFYIVLAVVAFFWTWDLLKRKWQRVVFTLIFAGAVLWPNLTFLPEQYELYSSLFVGGFRFARNFYTLTNGEEIDQAAEWFKKNTPEGTRIAVLGYDNILKKFVGNRSVVPHFSDEGIDIVQSRGAEYFVLHYHYMAGRELKIVADTKKKNPEHIVYARGVPIIKIYKVDYSQNTEVTKISLSPDKWTTFTNGEKAKLKLSKNDQELIFDYFFKEKRLNIASLSQKNNFLMIAKGLSVEIKGDNNKELFYVDFLPRGKKNYYRYKFPVDWAGWKKFYFPWEVFSEVVEDPQEKLPRAMQGNMILRISIDSHDDISGSLALRNLALSNKNEAVATAIEQTVEFLSKQAKIEDQIAVYDFRDYLTFHNLQMAVQVPEDTSEALPMILASQYLVIPHYKSKISDLLVFDYKQLQLTKLASFGSEKDFKILIFKVGKSVFSEVGLIDLSRLQTLTKSKKDQMKFEINPQAVQFFYTLAGPGEWVMAKFDQEFELKENTWLALEVFDDSNFGNMHIDLYDEKKLAYFRYTRSPETIGKKLLWIPLKLMKEVEEKGVPLNLSDKFHLRIGLDSGKEVSGQIIVYSAKILEIK